jgi:retron-type reverse transcriptase
MIALKHLFLCWEQFRRGKRKRKDVQIFERYLEDEIFQLHEELKTETYYHSSYRKFYIFDPKERHISKAYIRDRLVHHMVYNVLSEIYEPRFIFHSFSCRLGKGTHIGIEHLNRMLRRASLNNTRPCYGLKMDVCRFFDTVSHPILKRLLGQQIKDPKTLRLISLVIDSFKVSSGTTGNKGIPLGNVTSQIFSNIYLHELDQFVKQDLKEPFYLRYCDDYVLISEDPIHLKMRIPMFAYFLKKDLHLEVHPKKISLRKWSSGIDFLGYFSFPNHQLMRTSSKRRMYRRLNEAYESLILGKIDEVSFDQKLQSYLGMLSHAHQMTLVETLKNAYWSRC